MAFFNALKGLYSELRRKALTYFQVTYNEFLKEFGNVERSDETRQLGVSQSVSKQLYNMHTTEATHALTSC